MMSLATAYKAEKKKLQDDIDTYRAKLEVVGQDLQLKESDLNDLNGAIVKAQMSLDEITSRYDFRKRSYGELQEKALHLEEEVYVIEDGLTVKREELNNEINQSALKRESLKKEVEEVQAKLTSLSQDLMSNTKAYDELIKERGDRLSDITEKLSVAETRLHDTEKKDMEFRKGWADMALKQDKREQVLKKRELKSYDLDKRIQAQENFLKL